MDDLKLIELKVKSLENNLLTIIKDINNRLNEVEDAIKRLNEVEDAIKNRK